MKIKAILDIINSDPDRAGNCYWAFRYTETSTGRQVVGTISGGDSNIRAVFNRQQWKDWLWNAIYTTRHSFGYREFTRLTADWPYAGCHPDDLAKFILTQLRKRKKPNKS